LENGRNLSFKLKQEKLESLNTNSALSRLGSKLGIGELVDDRSDDIK
jgi:hypothetical protein